MTFNRLHPQLNGPIDCCLSLKEVAENRAERCCLSGEDKFKTYFIFRS